MAVSITRARRTVLPKLVMVGFLLVTLTYNVQASNDRGAAMDRLLSGQLFDFVTWTAEAALTKIGFETVQPQHGLSDEDQSAFARDFMSRVAEYQQLEAQVNRIYVNPDVEDPDVTSADLRAQRDRVKAEIDARQNLAEAILQEQVESVYREEGFSLGGQIIPPLRFRFTPLPYVLIMSPRDRIERIDQRELQTGLTVDEQDRIERDVSKRFNLSTLVTPIGGLGAYPTMLPETSSLEYSISVAAHEWVHNYLLLAPVGLNYSDDPVARIINETTATIVEQEISRRVVERYYPELVRPAEPAQPERPKARPQKADEPPPFDFRQEMRTTRLRVDDLLAAGKIEEAEAYMEERRKLFVEKGYAIRKLNQAYFAFHGAYNAEPGGSPTAGRDPIGPAVQALRQRSASVGDFLRAIATVRTLADVERAKA